MPVPGYEKRPPRERKAAAALKKALLAARRNGLTRADVRILYDQVESEQDARMQSDLMLYRFAGIDRNEDLFTRLWRKLCLAFGKGL